MNMENTTQLIGYLGADPMERTTRNEKEYVSFSLATHEHYRNAKGEKVTKTLWHSIEAYGTLGKRVKTFANKGDQVGVAGKLTYKKEKATIVAAEVLFLKKGEQTVRVEKEEEIKEAV